MATQPSYTATNYNQVKKPTYQTTAKPGNTVNYGDVANQINTAKTTQSQSQYQSPDWYAQAAQSNYQAMQPMRQQMNANTNAAYNQSSRTLSEMLAAKGLSRSGSAAGQLMQNEVSRNSALGANNSNILNQAIQQTIPQAQMGLSERGFLYGQQQDAVGNLAALLAQQTGAQQYADQYNNSLQQQQYQNALNQLGLQDQSNQWAAQFGQGQYQTGLDEAYRQAALRAQILNSLLGYGGTLAGSTNSAPIPDNWGSTLTQYLNAIRGGV